MSSRTALKAKPPKSRVSRYRSVTNTPRRQPGAFAATVLSLATFAFR